MGRSFRPKSLVSVWALPLITSVAAHATIAVMLIRSSGTAQRELTDVPGEAEEYVLTLSAEMSTPVAAQPESPSESAAEGVPSAADPVFPVAATVEPAVVHETSEAPIPSTETTAVVPAEPSRPPATSFREAGVLRPRVAAEAVAPATMPVSTERSASFAGVRAERAKKVVYAVDASGVMVSSLPFVLDELARNLSKLEPDQEFQVVVFQEPLRPQDEGPGPEPTIERLLEHTYWIRDAADETKPGLLSASVGTAAIRSRLEELRRRIRPGGPSNPLTGLRVALSLKPDVVFLLSRGIKRSGTAWGPGVEEVLSALDRANPKDKSGRRSVQIKTVQFVEADPTGLMDRIAKDHGGAGVGPAASGGARAAVLSVSDLRALGKGASPQGK